MLRQCFLLALAFAVALADPQVNCGIYQAAQDEPVDNLPFPKIVGGTEAKQHAWPWMVSLRRSSIFGTSHSCGAELIAPNWVLTAAHCVVGTTNPNSYRCDAGRHHRDTMTETVQALAVSRVIVHPRYNQGLRYSNDIALLELRTPAVINQYVQTACLPKTDATGGEDAKITGWGGTQGTCCVNLLKQAWVPVLSHATCTQSNILGGAVAQDSMVCAGPLEGGIDTCQGDSGGPLHTKVQLNNGTTVWQVNGLTSWGYGCAQPNRPGVYARVHTFVQWIKEVTGLEPPRF